MIFSSDLLLDSLHSGDITALDWPYFCQVTALQMPASCSPTSTSVYVTSFSLAADQSLLLRVCLKPV